MKLFVRFFSTVLFIIFLLLGLNETNLSNNIIQSTVGNIIDTTVCVNSEISTVEIVESTTIELDVAETESYSQDFPTITKAILYRNSIPEELKPTDVRLIKTVNYIMCSVQQKSYGYVTGVLPSSDIDNYHKNEKGVYLLLELDSHNSVEFSRYDSAVISGKTVILIDSDSVSYHGEGNPFNQCITPYYEDYNGLDSIPDILSLFF